MAVNVESATTTATRPLAAALVETRRQPERRRGPEVGQIGLYAALFGLSILFMILFSSSLVAYGFARLRFRGNKQLFALVMATYLLPAMVTFIPTFLIWNELGVVGKGDYRATIPLWAGNLFGSAFYIF